jgi:hypothetical protein
MGREDHIQPEVASLKLGNGCGQRLGCRNEAVVHFVEVVRLVTRSTLIHALVMTSLGSSPVIGLPHRMGIEKHALRSEALAPHRRPL